MRYLIAVVLSAVLIPYLTHPTLTKTAVHIRKQEKPTVQAVHLIQAVRPKAQTVAATQPTETYAYGCGTYDSIFRLYAWNVQVAEAICQAESGGNPYAVSNPYLNYDGISDYGLMQIHGEAIFNPSANIARAYQKYESQGWYAWSTYTSGRYAEFL